jgi:chaperonin GroES
MLKAPEDIIIIKKEKKSNEPEKSASGLLIIANDNDEDSKNIGTVVLVGEGRQLRSGVRVPMDVKVGDKVMYNPGGVMKFKHDGEEYMSMFSVSVLAILESDDEQD